MTVAKWTLRDYNVVCDTPFCRNTAKVKVLDPAGIPHGHYCRECGVQTMNSRNREEETMRQIREMEVKRGSGPDSR